MHSFSSNLVSLLDERVREIFTLLRGDGRLIAQLLAHRDRATRRKAPNALHANATTHSMPSSCIIEITVHGEDKPRQ
jgi:hypothetical protein